MSGGERADELAAKRDQLKAICADLELEIAQKKDFCSRIKRGAIDATKGAVDASLSETQKVCDYESGNYQVLEKEEKDLISQTERVAVEEDCLKARVKVSHYQNKYEVLLGRISSLESRMVKIMSAKSAKDREMESSKRQLSEVEQELEMELQREHQDKLDYEKLCEESFSLQQEHVEIESEVRAEKKRIEHLRNEIAPTHNAQVQDSVDDVQNELGKRQKLIEEHKSTMAMAREQDKKLEAEIELSKQRLESVREEFKAYRKTKENDIKDLENLLVESQNELGRLQGSTHERQRVITLAQKSIKNLQPWFGIELQSGVTQRVRVSKVKPGPCQMAGLMKGDIIEQAHGEYLRTVLDFRNMRDGTRPGDSISLQVQRQRKMMNLMVSISTKGVEFDDIIALRRMAGGIVQDGDSEILERIQDQGPSNMTK